MEDIEKYLFWRELPNVLGATNPCPNTVHTEPFSTSVFKVLTWIVATTAKICTKIHSNCIYMPISSQWISRPPTQKRILLSMSFLVKYKYFALAPSIFRANWFGWWVVTHSLAGSDFHGHRPSVNINQHLSWDLVSENLGTLTWLLVHPKSPILLTKIGPLGAQLFRDGRDFNEANLAPYKPI
jgi:hypothetical protein